MMSPQLAWTTQSGLGPFHRARYGPEGAAVDNRSPTANAELALVSLVACAKHTAAAPTVAAAAAGYRSDDDDEQQQHYAYRRTTATMLGLKAIGGGVFPLMVDRIPWGDGNAASWRHMCCGLVSGTDPSIT